MQHQNFLNNFKSVVAVSVLYILPELFNQTLTQPVFLSQSFTTNPKRSVDVMDGQQCVYEKLYEY